MSHAVAQLRTLFLGLCINIKKHRNFSRIFSILLSSLNFSPLNDNEPQKILIDAFTVISEIVFYMVRVTIVSR